eukprot:EG_transcript_24821
MVGSVRSARSVPSKQRYATVDVMDNGGRDDGWEEWLDWVEFSTRSLLFTPAALEVRLAFHVCMLLSVLAYASYCLAVALPVMHTVWTSAIALGIFCLTVLEVSVGLASYRFSLSRYCSGRGGCATLFLCSVNLAFWVAYELDRSQRLSLPLVHSPSVFFFVLLLRCLHDVFIILGILAQPIERLGSISLGPPAAGESELLGPSPCLHPQYGACLPQLTIDSDDSWS